MTNTMKVSKRQKTGKGAIRANRLKGFIPAVIYGDKKAPELITVEEKIIVMEMAKPGFWLRQYDLELDGEKHHVICQDVQLHPVSDRPVHADFLRVSKDSVLTLQVPVHVKNEETSIGIKKGGVLNIVHREIEVSCPATAIPESFVIDLETLDIGDVVTLGQIEMPKGVKPSLDEEETILSITPPQAEVVEPAVETADTASADAGKAAPAKEEK
jgi:large subunit ribosomal protein L25